MCFSKFPDSPVLPCLEALVVDQVMQRLPVVVGLVTVVDDIEGRTRYSCEEQGENGYEETLLRSQQERRFHCGRALLADPSPPPSGRVRLVRRRAWPFPRPLPDHCPRAEGVDARAARVLCGNPLLCCSVKDPDPDPGFWNLLTRATGGRRTGDRNASGACGTRKKGTWSSLSR